MSFVDHQGESEFPFNKETVFNAITKAIPMVKGMGIDTADKLQGRIVVKASVSLMSWGENIPILLSEITENRTKVKIISTPKTGVMFGGTMDLGKNRKNIELILSATSKILSSQNEKQINTTEKQNQKSEYSNSNPVQINMEETQYKKKWYDNKFITHLLLVLFFPIGLYALWNSRTIAKWWKITASVLIGLIVIANLGDDKTSNDNSTTEKTIVQKKSKIQLTQAQKDSIVKVEKVELYKQRKSQTVSAKNLYYTYQENEVSADNDFKGKKFYVEGIIRDIGKDLFDNIYITIKTGDIIGSVQCFINDANKVSKLRKGQKITVYGKCDGLMMNVLMKNCKITENLNDLK